MAFSVFFFRLSLVGDPTALNVIPGVPLSQCGSPQRPAHTLGELEPFNRKTVTGCLSQRFSCLAACWNPPMER